MAYDTPDAGVNYGDLSRLTQPQMMPEAPLGGGSLAGLMYGQDMSRHDDAIAQATQLAQLNSTMKEAAAGEYKAGAPGRAADISLGNIMSQNKLGSAPDLAAKQTNEAQTGAMASRRAKIEEEMNALGPFASSWNNAKTPAAKQVVRMQMQDKGVDKIGNKNLEDIPDENLDGVMGMVFNRSVNDPPQAKKIQQLQQTGENWQNREDLKGQYANQRAMISAAAKERAAELSKQGKEANKKWIEGYYEKVGKGQNTEVDDKIYQTITFNALYGSYLRGDQAQPQINPAAINPKDGPPLIEKPPVPKPAGMPAPKEISGYKLNGQKENATEATKEGKTVKILGFNPKTNEYFLEDGSKIK